MHILLLRHYPRAEGPSMRAFADQIAAGLRGRGHIVQEETAPVLLGGLLPRNHPAAKWLGYGDQFLIFPLLLWWRVRLLPKRALCVLADQALGPWLPWLGSRAHLVHCHDLLALEASFGLQPFHRLGYTGRVYQRYILKGLRKASFFLSVSVATQAAVERFLPPSPRLSAVLYNPLPVRFMVIGEKNAAASVQKVLPQIGRQPFLLHIGRNWYKNKLGVLAIWEHLHGLGFPLKLVLVGSVDPEVDDWLDRRLHLSPWLHVLEEAGDELVVALYNQASALLFPSHAEGFGWPILEALACGCPVITTNRPPMTEVGGQAVTTIPPAPPPPEALDAWAWEAAQQVKLVLTRNPAEQERFRELGFAQARRFQLELWLDQLESYYQQALALQENRACAA
jgi:glycosyltransferase involved in cell wall biosynthesis